MMISRRTVLNGSALGSALAALAPEAAVEARGGGAVQASSERAIEDATQAIRSLREEMLHRDSFWEIGPVRDQIKTFLRSTGKFPEYIEVGIDVWQQVYDWHVRYGQPINIGRNAEGRYTIVLMTTTVVMRPDLLAASYIGMPYDSR
jgi:hypothetical protein